jgi:serine/threonine-protein phosphatase 2A regulatory subunit A
VLIDGLRSEEVDVRLVSAKSLSTISAALGSERTVDELIPFLSETLDDDDAVLLALAGSLPELLPLLPPKDVPALLKPLGLLLTVEEAAVRQSAIASLTELLPSFPPGEIVGSLAPLVQRLGSSSFFTSRLSAADLLPVFLRYLPKQGEEGAEGAAQEIEAATALFATLSRDDTPMVRGRRARASEDRSG